MASIFTKIAESIKKKWAESFGFNFSYGTALAIQQETVFAAYMSGTPISPATILNLERNAWVALAAHLAPCNLVLRQWCLIDLLRGRASNLNGITVLLDKISYKNSQDDTYRIFAEGYSYWQYVRLILDQWVSLFFNAVDLTYIKSVIKKIDLGFIQTSYSINNVLYPVLLGDLRQVPLDQPLQIVHQPAKSIAIGNVQMSVFGNNVVYKITGKPLGFNLHIPKNDYTITVSNGVVTDWTWYIGYDKKYPNTATEIADMLSLKRILSI